VADHLTEEEQIEAIKRWWKENWLSLVLPIVLAIAGYTGWNMWQDHKLKSAQMASDKYQALLSFYESPTFTESQRGQALLLADEIASEYSNSLYADLSLMLAARIAVEQNELGKAGELLTTVVENGKTDAMVQLAKARLAKVFLADGKLDQAAALVSSSSHDSAKSLYAEIRGDIYLAQGQHAAARTAYEEALASLMPDQANHAAIIQFKLRGVAQDDTKPAAEDVSSKNVPSEDGSSEDQASQNAMSSTEGENPKAPAQE